MNPMTVLLKATLIFVLFAQTKATSMETYTDPKLGYSFSYPDSLAIRTFEEDDAYYVYLVPKSEAPKANSIAEANRRARAYGRQWQGSPPPTLPGKAKNANGVEHFLYQTITNEGKPSEWKVVVPVDGWTVSFMLSLRDGELAKTIAETFQLRKAQ
jgi:hypothetical protein